MTFLSEKAMHRPSMMAILFSLCLLSPALTACTTNTTDGGAQTSLSVPIKNADILYGDKRDKLSTIEKIYKSNPQDQLIAARYGKALREAGKYKDAKAILLPLSKEDEIATFANTELSAVHFAQGNFGQAEKYARKAVKADKNNYRAWRNLGNALDAQEEYKEGEEAFDQALKLWGDEDKVPVMNNLALNYAAQGYTDKALSMLYEAQKLDPARVEIERNIRIIRTLNEPPEYLGEKKPLPANRPPEE
ncbi:MAG: tetratricopeptide repeat protein [Alphaproteobacteria bacterium]|nr:tetratricopeptide repeat protein [Alphaproteobacteria bacterium]